MWTIKRINLLENPFSWLITYFASNYRSFDVKIQLIGQLTFFLFMQEFNIFFHAYFNKVVTWSDRLEFVNGWYILIIVSDTLTIAGSSLKIGIQTKVCLFLVVFPTELPCGHGHLFQPRLLSSCSS